MTIPTRTNPFKKLAAAVIFQAVRDATCQMGTAKKSATTWLLENDEGFRFWCNVPGMDPDQTRQELSELLYSPMTRCKVDFQSLFQPVSEDQERRVICRAANSKAS